MIRSLGRWAQFPLRRFSDDGKGDDPLIFAISLNVVTSIMTISLNKVASNNESFRFGSLLSVFHFCVSHAFLRAAAAGGVFEPKDISWSVKAPLIMSYAGYVFFNNSSLIFNSVSFYQITKLLVTPLVLVIQSKFYGMGVSRRVQLSLLPLLIGSSVYITSDISTTPVGLLIAGLATVSNALYTVWGGTMQTKANASSLQMLYHQSLWSALFCFPAIFLFDDVDQMWLTGFKTSTLIYSLLSASCAVALNTSFYLVAGKTSPLTTNVLGYLKTLLVLVIGVIYFHDRTDLNSVFGMACTMLGLLLYSKCKMDEAAAASVSRKDLSSLQSISLLSSKDSAPSPKGIDSDASTTKQI